MASCVSIWYISVTPGSKTCVGAVRALSDPRTAVGGTPDDRASAGRTPDMCASAPVALVRCQSSTWFHRRVRLPVASSAADGRRCSRWPPPSCNLSLHSPHSTADGMRPGPGMPPAALTRDVDACSPRSASLQVMIKVMTTLDVLPQGMTGPEASQTRASLGEICTRKAGG